MARTARGTWGSVLVETPNVLVRIPVYKKEEKKNVENYLHAR